MVKVPDDEILRGRVICRGDRWTTTPFLGPVSDLRREKEGRRQVRCCFSRSEREDPEKVLRGEETEPSPEVLKRSVVPVHGIGRRDGGDSGRVRQV